MFELEKLSDFEGGRAIYILISDDSSVLSLLIHLIELECRNDIACRNEIINPRS